MTNNKTILNLELTVDLMQWSTTKSSQVKCIHFHDWIVYHLFGIITFWDYYKGSSSFQGLGYPPGMGR